jgi:hypothetical protein
MACVEDLFPRWDQRYLDNFRMTEYNNIIIFGKAVERL